MSENNLINIVKTVYNEYRDNPVIFQKLLNNRTITRGSKKYKRYDN